MARWNPFQPSEDALPPNQVRIIDLRAEPWPNQHQRIRVHLEITPFIERPNLEVVIVAQEGNPISSIHVIETIEALMTFTMHLRGEPIHGPFKLNARLFYPDTGIVDEKSIPFDIQDIDG